MKLTARTILITGGSSGIGLEMAGQLLARGNVVIVTGRSGETLEAAKRRFPGLHALSSDASNADDIRALHDMLIKRFPGTRHAHQQRRDNADREAHRCSTAR